ncbi:MAG TPA: SDR family NAD(P)-dependent oxidoreductase [Spirochaetota bacterium]|nr:SDR family NAD(P)-dependent oxidoreductase [Spirochaetota bacterium]HPI91389.1 SDR family NAD(P)-dependent oxidoreductase [Spirochaetota bacterium]HPR48529.1 SDR family NAD(P)-dependent oxidoreductase [Spirochaetota bacterium]
MIELKGKTAIITGASAGIGESIARCFADEGANVVLIARSKGPLEKLAAQLDPQRVAVYAMNVTDYPSFSRVLSEVKSRWGTVDYLINNAGAHSRGTVATVDPDGLIQMARVNFEAPIVLTRMVLDIFKEQQCGMVINIASLSGRTPIDGMATYSATKFGLRAFSYALAEELRETYPHIKCCLVSPSPVSTGFIMDDIEHVSEIALSQPLVTAEVVAEKVLKTVRDAKMERITGGALSGIMTTLGYLFPRGRRAVKPLLKAKGRRVREKILAQGGCPQQ